MPGPTRLLRSRSSRRACGNPSRKAARGGGAVSRVAIADAKQGWPADHVARWPIDRLIPFAKNARTHTPAQIAQLAASMREWGWTSPVLADEQGGLIAGHARLLAARQLGIAEIPVMVARGWTADGSGSSYPGALSRLLRQFERRSAPMHGSEMP